MPHKIGAICILLNSKCINADKVCVCVYAWQWQYFFLNLIACASMSMCKWGGGGCLCDNVCEYKYVWSCVYVSYIHVIKCF